MRGCGCARRGSRVTPASRSACSLTWRRRPRAKFRRLGELLAGAGRLRDAERAYRAATKDAALGPLAIYRRARILVRLNDPGAREALAGFAQSYPGDSAAPTALYVLGDMFADRGDWAGAAQWFGELVARYPADVRASLARFRLAAETLRHGLLDSTAARYQAGVAP